MWVDLVPATGVRPRCPVGCGVSSWSSWRSQPQPLGWDRCNCWGNWGSQNEGEYEWQQLEWNYGHSVYLVVVARSYQSLCIFLKPVVHESVCVIHQQTSCWWVREPCAESDPSRGPQETGAWRPCKMCACLGAWPSVLNSWRRGRELDCLCVYICPYAYV